MKQRLYLYAIFIRIRVHERKEKKCFFENARKTRLRSYFSLQSLKINEYYIVHKD